MAKSNKRLLIGFLEKMLTIRYFEDQVDNFYMKGKVRGTGHLYTGMEAIAVGSIQALDKGDLITSTHRGHGHCIAKGSDVKLMMAELLGKATGYCKGKGGSMHIADIDQGNLGANGIVGGSIAIATGAALAIKEMATKQVILCFIGDGATNQGVFHESLNMASIWKLPVVYIIENNQYGMGFSIKKAVNIKKLSERAASYGIKGITIDGNDVILVYESSNSLIDSARNGNGPILLECESYRWRGHSKMDAERYRAKKEVMEWKKKCPIEKHKKYLIKNNIATAREIKNIEEKIKEKIIQASIYALDSPYPDSCEATTDVYA